MLKNIDPLLTPDLLRALAEMGHGDVLAVVDRNYPAYSCGQRVVEQPAADLPQMMAAILTVFPVDTFVEPAAWQMLTADGTPGPVTAEVEQLLSDAEGRPVAVGGLERFAFYERATQVYCTVHTGETRPYGCYLITKGVC